MFNIINFISCFYFLLSAMMELIDFPNILCGCVCLCMHAYLHMYFIEMIEIEEIVPDVWYETV